MVPAAMATAGLESAPRLSFAVTPAPWVAVTRYFRLDTALSPPASPMVKPEPLLLSEPAVRDAASAVVTCVVAALVMRSTFQLVAVTPVAGPYW